MSCNLLWCSQKLVRLCGEVLAAPTENEEIQFLCIVCAKLKQDPYLVNFFLEVSRCSDLLNVVSGDKQGRFKSLSLSRNECFEA